MRPLTALTVVLAAAAALSSCGLYKQEAEPTELRMVFPGYDNRDEETVAHKKASELQVLSQKTVQDESTAAHVVSILEQDKKAFLLTDLDDEDREEAAEIKGLYTKFREREGGSSKGLQIGVYADSANMILPR